MRDSVIDVAGTKLGYREAGAGATVLFLHGAAGAAWDPLLDQLSSGYRMLAPEHPGFGRGQVPDWMLSVGDVALLAPAGVETREAMFDDIFAWTTEEFARRQFHDPKLAQEWQQAQAKLDIDIALQNRTALARLGWNPRMHNPQLPYWLHRIDVPTLLVWGEDDQVVPFACHKPFKREIRNAELLALPKSGHALPIERAHEVGARLAPFFQGAQG